MKKKKLPLFLIVIWGLNLLGLLGLFIFLWTKASLRTSPALASVDHTSPTTSTSFAPLLASPLSPSATAYILPTLTPNPRSTLIVGTTPTPFDFIPNMNSAKMIIGYSVEGRPLEVYRFGHGASERLIIAGIHGGYEWNTIVLADELIAEINTHPELVPDDVTLYILRALNPDGDAYEHGRGGRANKNGVDLNHNFPYHWKEDWDREGCWNYLPITAGASPASEPETIALINFIDLHDFDALISYHSAALGIFAGGMPPFAPSEDLAKTLSNSSPYLYPPLNTGCEYSGNLTDWAASVKGIPSVDIELTNHHDTDFGANLRILGVFLRWQR